MTLYQIQDGVCGLMVLSAVLLLFGFRSVPVDQGGKRGAERIKQEGKVR
jgi:hypothetical protein